MKIPTVSGIIDRRILVNFHIDPSVLAPLLPSPFTPKIINGYAIGGICLIRLKKIKPKSIPLVCGISSENAAHRFAVEWSVDGKTQEGVYIPRRDTDSYLNSLLGGRLFPGVHNHAKFNVRETATNYSVSMRSCDGTTSISVDTTVTPDLHEDSVFSNLGAASDFFEAGSLGYSKTSDPNRFDGLELKCQNWQVSSLKTISVSSSYFDDKTKFPAGSIQFDSALLMLQIQHEWESHADLCCLASSA